MRLWMRRPMHERSSRRRRTTMPSENKLDRTVAEGGARRRGCGVWLFVEDGCVRDNHRSLRTVCQSAHQSTVLRSDPRRRRRRARCQASGPAPACRMARLSSRIEISIPTSQGNQTAVSASTNRIPSGNFDPIYSLRATPQRTALRFRACSSRSLWCDHVRASLWFSQLVSSPKGRRRKHQRAHLSL